MNRREALKQTAFLGGGAVLTTSLLPLLQSCQVENRATWTPEFLNPEQAKLVSALVDIILPKTESPGGLDVKVDIFIDKVYARLYDKEAQIKALEELEAFNKRSEAAYNKGFYQLAPPRRDAFLKKEESNSPKFNPGIWGTPIGEQEPVGFFRSFKSLAIWGYCSSEEIAKNVLNYDPIPGGFDGCIPFAEVGRVWSL